MTSAKPAGLLGVLILIILLLLVLGPALLPFLLAIVLALGLKPVYLQLIAHKIPPSGSAALATLFGTLLLSALLVSIVDFVVVQVNSVWAGFPALQKTLREIVENHDWLDQLPQVKMGIKKLINQPMTPIVQSPGATGTAVLAVTGTTFDWLMTLALTPFITFYILRDAALARDAFENRIDPPVYTAIVSYGQRARRQLKEFFTGQLRLCLVEALIHATALWVIGLQFGVVIGLLTGLAALIPVIGNLTMFAVALFVAFLQQEGWQLPLLVVAVYAGTNIFETAILTPWLIGNRMRIHPLGILVVLVVGANLFGLIGAIVALPVAALISAIWPPANQQLETGDA